MRVLRWLSMAAALLCPAGGARAHEDLALQVEEAAAAIAAAPDARGALLHRAELLRLRGEFAAAADDYDRAEALGADTAELLLGRAALARSAGDPDAALRLLNDLLRLCPRDPRAFELRAEARLARGGASRAAGRAAAADLGRAIELSPLPEPDLVLRRARLLAESGDAGLARALDALREALDRWGPSAALEAEAVAYAAALGRDPGPALEAAARGGGRPPRSPAAPRGRGASAATASPAVLRGPYLQSGTPHSIVLRWRTDIPTETVVRYGAVPGEADVTVSDEELRTDHELALTGLHPATRYYYSVGTSASALAGGDSLHAFVTAPPAGDRGPLRLWVIGDSGLPGADQRAVRDAWHAFCAARPAAAWLMLGDNAYTSGTDAQYQAAVFDVYQAMLRTTALWPTRGNHDLLHGGAGNDYYDIFTLPAAGQAGGEPSGTEAWYAFDLANVHLVCLDSYGSDRSPGGAMLTWLQADLAAAAAAASPPDWIVAFWHHPPYTKGSHDSDTEGALIEMRENALPVLEAGGVDLVLTGHSHSYERSCLLDGHYGPSATLADSMKLDPGDGRVPGGGSYRKPAGGPAAHAGAVYAVAGSSSRTSGGSLDHPAMVVSLNELGSLVLDFEGLRLDARFLDAGGEVRDEFIMVKGSETQVAAPGLSAHGAPGLRIRPVPAPDGATVEFTLSRGAAVRLEVFDAGGRRLATLLDAWRAAGTHAAAWSAREAGGARLPGGVYFVRLTVEGRARTEKLLLAR